MARYPFRCDYCGQFMSYSDMESGKAKWSVYDDWDWHRDEHRERADGYHVACEERAGATPIHQDRT